MLRKIIMNPNGQEKIFYRCMSDFLLLIFFLSLNKLCNLKCKYENESLLKALIA